MMKRNVYLGKGCKWAIAFMLVLSVVMLPAFPAFATITNNGAPVYISTGDSFDPAGATYARIIALKHNGAHNGTLLATFDQLKLVGGRQVYPIYESTDNGATWSLKTNVYDTMYGTDRTSQPDLFELPQQVGDLPAGTILLAGNVFPEDKSSTRIMIWKSTDRGATWSVLSTVDTGGPYHYDPSPGSTTTTIWEPFLYLDKDGNLVCAYSDERQKANGVLQAIVLRKSTDGGQTWGPLVNITAIPNMNDRPGMVTVAKLPNGKYIATYEMVNKPSQALNTAVVYYKFSDDGVTWNASDPGTPIQLANGRGIGSSPYVRWVEAGGPNGMIVVSSKWGLTDTGHISGGQHFYVNYHLGEGPWERMPYAVTYDASDTQGGFFSGFAQSFDISPDGRTLYHITNVENLATTYNDIRVGTLPLNSELYEAERGLLSNVSLIDHFDASGGQKVGYINYADSSVIFQNVKVPTSGNYTVNVRYANGTGATSSHFVSVNGGPAFEVHYPATVDWGRYLWASFTVWLNAGDNTIEFTKGTGFAELDAIDVYRSGVSNHDYFMIKNRNSGKLLEIFGNSTADGAEATQWGDTGYPCQLWAFVPAGGGYFYIVNKNSGKYLDVASSSLSDGARIVQQPYSGGHSQQWSLTLTDNGYFKIINRNSGKLLEVYGNSPNDGAEVVQWGETGVNGQQWTLVKEGSK